MFARAVPARRVKTERSTRWFAGCASRSRCVGHARAIRSRIVNALRSRCALFVLVALGAFIAACRTPGREGNPCRYRRTSLRAHVAARLLTGMEAAASGYTCDEGLFCDTANGANMCVRPRAVDGLCADDAQCTSGLFCDTAQSPARCAAPRAAGGSCRSADQCASPLFCIEGRCAPARRLGEPCADGIACDQGLACIDGRCSAGRTLGQPCDGVARCAAGLVCTQGVCVRGHTLGEPCDEREVCVYELGCVNGRCAASQ